MVVAMTYRINWGKSFSGGMVYVYINDLYIYIYI